MSQRLLKALGGVTSIAIATTLLQVAPAAARSAPVEPELDAPPALIVVTATAKGPGHFNSSVSTDVPVGGTSTITSPTLPKDMTTAKVTVTTNPDEEGLLLLAYMMLQLPTPGRRVLACLSMVGDRLNTADMAASINHSMSQYDGVEQTELLVRLTTCMYVASLVSQFVANGGARQAATGCGQAPVGIREQITNSGGQYHLTSAGTTVRKKNAKVKIRCRVLSDHKVEMTVKPRKKGTTLRKALGTTSLYVGLASPSTAAGGTTVKVAFKAP